jgi:hypothetical protein
MNVKILLVAVLITSLSFVLTAQDKPSFIGLKAGASFPVGKFHAKELPDGGFALAGFGTSIEGAWFFKKWLGVGASAGLYLHPVDVISLADEKISTDNFMNSLTILSDPYLSVSVYSGLYFQFHLVQRLSLTAKALGGVIYAQTPYQLFKADYYLIGEHWFDVTSSGDYKGSFLTGAGLRYDLNGCIGFTLDSEFTYNMMKFDFIESDGSVRTDKRVVSFVNLMAGIVIRIG